MNDAKQKRQKEKEADKFLINFVRCSNREELFELFIGATHRIIPTPKEGEPFPKELLFERFNVLKSSLQKSIPPYRQTSSILGAHLISFIPNFLILLILSVIAHSTLLQSGLWVFCLSIFMISFITYKQYTLAMGIRFINTRYDANMVKMQLYVYQDVADAMQKNWENSRRP